MLTALELLVFNVAEINAEMVVPTLAPIIKGAACLRVATFFATIGTTTDVVTVLERIAAVVTTPHPKDFNGFSKKKRLNASGDFAFSKSEMIFRKIKIELNSNTSAKNDRMKGLCIRSTK